MSVENNIVLTATAFGSVYLCSNALKEINNSKYGYKTLPFYCNYFAFGLSAGIFISIVKHTLRNK
jgi:hypothetical protein